MFKGLKSGKYLILVLVLVLAFAVTGCTSSEQSSEVVATVGDAEISKDDFYDKLVEQYGQETLDAMISEKIIEAEIEKADIDITQEDIDKEFANMENYYGGADVLAQTMAQYGMTREDMDENIKSNLAIKNLVGSDIEITDAEIAEFYLENSDIFNKPEQVNASHILVDTEDEANEVIGKLDAGEIFEDLALEYSIDGSASNGGNLGFFGKGQMVEPFEDAAFSLPIGEVSKPVQSEFGYHIIKVLEKTEGTEGSLEGNKEEIKDMIMESKIPEAFTAWYEAKLEEYKVVNNLNK